MARRPLALIVEDNVLYARGVTRGLENHGYETVVTQTGAEAERMFTERMPDVVLLDHHLRDTQGFALLPVFKRPGTRVVVIVMTGDISTDLAVHIVRGEEEPAEAPSDLGNRIASMLRWHGLVEHSVWIGVTPSAHE